MKTMTCKQLGGACNIEFHANSFEEMVNLSKMHGMEMYQKQDPLHMDAMAQIQDLIQNPSAMQEWFDSKKKLFDSLEEK